jgi:hypothetical protein
MRCIFCLDLVDNQHCISTDCVSHGFRVSLYEYAGFGAPSGICNFSTVNFLYVEEVASLPEDLASAFCVIRLGAISSARCLFGSPQIIDNLDVISIFAYRE